MRRSRSQPCTESHVYFAVFDFGDEPTVVTTIMGVQPSIAWVKGERYMPSQPEARRTHSRWVIQSGLDETESLEAHLQAILSKLEPLRAEIEQVRQRFPLHVGVAQYFREVNPQFHLEADVIRRFAELGLAIDFDQYCLLESQAED